MPFEVARQGCTASAVVVLAACHAACAAGPPESASDQRMPRIAATEPAAAEATFRVLGGFRLQLLAAEPLVNDPVAMVYDENGVAYVAEMRDYPYTDKNSDQPFQDRTADQPLGRVRRLEDVDGDGRFDRSTVFAEELSWPTGLAVWQGGLYVAATPDLWYLRDTDGDGLADQRRKVFTGFRKFNVQAVMNNLAWGLDHRLYAAGGTNGGTLRNVARNEPPQVLAQQDYRFDPRDESLELLSGGARFGNTFDDWGQRFICNIRNPLVHVVLERRYLARNPHLGLPTALHDAALAGDTLVVHRISPSEPWRARRAIRWAHEVGQRYPRSETVADGYFTSASGATVYRGAAYPQEYRGNVFVGEVSGNLIHRMQVTAEGVTFAARRADGGAEFAASTDNWFRPVNFVNAPDGTLHVLDMYRETIEHPWSIPDDIKAQLDLESGRDRGRIYRLAPPDFRPPPPPRLGQATTLELVAALENPHGWWRDTAQRLLYERQDPAAEAPLRALVRSSQMPLARLHALCALEGLGRLTVADLVAALNDSAPGVRRQALVLAEPRVAHEGALAERVLAAAEDAEPLVRFQAALALGAADDPRVAGHLAKVARRDAADRWMRAAVLSSASRCSGAILRELALDADFCSRSDSAAMLQDLAFVVVSQSQEAAKTALAAALIVPAAATDARRAIVLGLGQGLKRQNLSLEVLTASDAAPPERELVAGLLKSAAATACDSAQSIERRLAAVELVSCTAADQASPTLARLVASHEPLPVQLAAVRALASFADDQVSRVLLAELTGLSPGVRGEVVQTLLARPASTRQLLAAVDRGEISPAEVPPARRALLAKHADTTIRTLAERLFAGESPAERARLIDDYRQAVRAGGDPQRGRGLLERECLICHRLGDRGHDVGPNLLGVLHRSPDELITHILDPNREVAPNFVEHVITRSDGRIATGLIAAETATSLSLRRAEGQQDTILRADIEAISSSGRSLMPEGLEKKLTPADLADLLAYLLSGGATATGKP